MRLSFVNFTNAAVLHGVSGQALVHRDGLVSVTKEHCLVYPLLSRYQKRTRLCNSINLIQIVLAGALL